MVESGLPTPSNCTDAAAQNTIEMNAVCAVDVGVDDDVNADREVDAVYLEEMGAEPVPWVSGVGAEPVPWVSGVDVEPVPWVSGVGAEPVPWVSGVGAEPVD